MRARIRIVMASWERISKNTWIKGLERPTRMKMQTRVLKRYMVMGKVTVQGEIFVYKG